MFNSLSEKSRSRKLRMFFSLLRPGPQDRVLDIGGECDPGGSSVQLSDNYPWKHRLTILNIDSHAMQRVKATYPQTSVMLGDACRLPFPDKAFEIGFSNAVIEHLFSWPNQQAMAAEMQRVCKRWFLSTPNRWYPYEFHSRIPFVSWLPAALMHKATRILCYNHVHHRYMSGLRTDEIRLLTAREMRLLFPRSHIIPVRITFMAETLLAVGGISPT